MALLDGPQQKQWHKAQKKSKKQEAKAAKARAKLGNAEPEGKPRARVLDFKGSMDAHEVNSLCGKRSPRYWRRRKRAIRW